MTGKSAQMPTKPAALCLAVCLALLISACRADVARVPLGTWHDASAQRYITVARGNQGLFNAVLFSYSAQGVKRARSVPAVMQKGVLTLKAQDADIPVLYHPSNQFILVNGVSEFWRVSTPGTITHSLFPRGMKPNL